MQKERLLMITKTIGQVSFSLRDDFDFSFLKAYGEPFIVFDRQDSGNLCFGVQSMEGRRFIKLAGASPIRSGVSPGEAVKRLQATIPLYEALAHPALTRLLGHQAVDGGHLLVFEWFDGKCMGKQYDAHAQFLGLPLGEKLAIYDVILDFHRHVNEKGYVAIDFYDGAILYNFQTRQTMLCDIEFYRCMPVFNDMGRMWGSTRFMSPEEFILGAPIDERSNVFCMGATAFCLMGGALDRSMAKWQASERLHAVASKATSARREDRYPTVRAFMEAWQEARR